MDDRKQEVYLQYFSLADTAYRERVRFYEENPKSLSSLSYDDRLEIDFDYLYCLFELGRYDRYLSKVDPFIELVIVENIYQFHGENIFEELLFRKAACYFQLCEYEKCNNILKQLIKMNPSGAFYIGLYTISSRRIRNDVFLTIKAVSVMMLIIVMGISIASIFLEPFFQGHIQPLIGLRNVLAVLAIVTLIGKEIFFQFQVYKETGMFSYNVINKIFGTI